MGLFNRLLSEHSYSSKTAGSDHVDPTPHNFSAIQYEVTTSGMARGGFELLGDEGVLLRCSWHGKPYLEFVQVTSSHPAFAPS